MTLVNDTQGYLDLRARAEAASASQAWAEAVSLWTTVAARNPVDGTNWLLLAEAHEAAGAYHAAIDAWEQVRALGAESPADACYRMACCHARAGEPELALTRLQQAFTCGYRYLAHAQTDPALESLHTNPHFRDLVALIDPTNLSRDAGWRQDLTLFARQVKRTGYAPFRYIAESEFDTAVDVLRTAIPHLTDLQIATELMKLARLVGDGHTWVLGLDDFTPLLPTLPLQCYLFDEGLFIIAADPTYEDLLGAEVVRVGEQPVATVLAGLDPLISRDNDHWPKQLAPYLLRELPLLHALGLIPSPHVGLLSEATGGKLDGALRYRELLGPRGLGYELRGAFTTNVELWGAVCLNREKGLPDFGARELAFIRRVAPHIGAGLRAATLLQELHTDLHGDDAAGVLILDQRGTVVQQHTAAAERWLQELGDTGAGWCDGQGLPTPILQVLGALRKALKADTDRDLNRTPQLCVRGRSGRLLTLQASETEPSLARPAESLVIIAPAGPKQVLGLTTIGYGLSPREHEVVDLVIRGASTRQIAQALIISEYTVKDHLANICEKVGVRGRR